MRITSFFSNSRGTSNLISRFRTIFSRFGLTSSRFQKLLDKYSEIMVQSQGIATLPITAVILKRHPGLIRRYVDKGIQFAVHGYVHIDYQYLSGHDQIEHYKKALSIFNDYTIPFNGFRAPYLRYNEDTPFALYSLGFLYNSSESVFWNVIDKSRFTGDTWSEYLRVLDFYQAHNSRDYLSLPRLLGDKKLVEIPVSLPDDEILLERLGIHTRADIIAVWSAILQETYSRGELFTLSLHPERILECGEALMEVINQAKGKNPAVWIATLGEIASWWQEMNNFHLDVGAEAEGAFHIQAFGSERATLLVKNCQVSCDTITWIDGYQIPKSLEFQIFSPKSPVIGLPPRVPVQTIHFLKSEGFEVELSDNAANYGIYLADSDLLEPAAKKQLIDNLKHTDAPLLRFWRWPTQAKSALSISGDIDSITLTDFALRLWEARQARNNNKYQGEVAHAGATV